MALHNLLHLVDLDFERERSSGICGDGCYETLDSRIPFTGRLIGPSPLK
jgi:hypothetical protein